MLTSLKKNVIINYKLKESDFESEENSYGMYYLQGIKRKPTIVNFEFENSKKIQKNY